MASSRQTPPISLLKPPKHADEPFQETSVPIQIDETNSSQTDSLETSTSDTESDSEVHELSASERNPWKNGLEWPATIWIGLIHLGALAAPFCFSWQGLGIAVFLSWVTGSLGICLGFHRMLTHSSFETYRPVRWFFTTMGTLAGEGPPIMWVAAHRKHHLHSDQDEDPHTPMHGGWWSHVLWMLPKHETRYWSEMYRRFAPDMMSDRYIRFLNRTFLWWHVGIGITLFTVGWLGWDLRMGFSFLVYGLFVRAVYVLHITWFVNSASHMWGYQTYQTDDNSRNLWWVGLVAFGEGWHNNHHADQRRARHGHRWWELDVTFAVIWAMERCGLVWNVVRIPSDRAVASQLSNKNSEKSRIAS